MRLRYVLPCAGAIVLLFGLYWLFPRQEQGDHIGAFDNWSPTPAEVSRTVGPGGGGTYTDDRHRTFANMFKKRFRDRSFAVGMKFLSDSKIKLMFAATIPRWDMVRVAIQANQEAMAIFGRPHQVDIYETYISVRHRKLAEVHYNAETKRYLAYFDSKFHQEWAPDNPRRPPEAPSARTVPSAIPPPVPIGFRPLSEDRLRAPSLVPPPLWPGRGRRAPTGQALEGTALSPPEADPALRSE